MSTISAGKLTANSLVHLGDLSGALVFQTNGTTTALTLDSSQTALFAGDVTVTGNLTVNGTTTSFGDNDKIVLGDGNDLQIYHDGSNSYIDDAGTGGLLIRGSTVTLGKFTGENMVVGTADGAVTLYYDNGAKLATTSTGVQTTGTISVNGAYTLPTTDGTAGFALTTNGAGAVSFTKVGRDPILVSTSTTAEVGNYYVATSGNITITLPTGPDSGDYVEIHDGTGAAATTSITIGRNGSSIAGAAEDFTLDVNFAKLHMVYVGGSVGWTV
jgi:hypothetical protein